MNCKIAGLIAIYSCIFANMCIFAGLIARVMEFARIIENQTKRFLGVFPCVAIVGPRQVGKTTFCKSIMSKLDANAIYLDLESDEDLQKIQHAEQYFNQRHDKLIVIDEIQRKPELFKVLRSVIDKKRVAGRFILLGSASPELLAQSSETLAGRIGYIEMHPLLYNEIKPDFDFTSLWLKGGFPDMFLQNDLEMSVEMRTQFIQTYLERELPILGLSASPILLKNLLKMVAHSQGSIVNYSEIAKSIGIEVNTVKRYLEYFENAFLIRRIYPFYTNSKKRIVKSPKIYIRDTGLFHAMFNIVSREDLDGFLKKGNSWESFVIQQIIAQLKPGITPYFYRTQDGTEMDLVLEKGSEAIVGIEIKFSNAPKLTRSTSTASKDLGDIPIYVVTHSVSEDYNHKENIVVTGFDRIIAHLSRMGLTE